MFGNSNVVEPFRCSLPDLSAKTDFGYAVTNISGGALPRGSVVLPDWDDTGHSTDLTKIGGTDGIFTRVTIAGTDLYDAVAGLQNALGPFYVVTNAEDDPVADNGTAYVWDGGPDGSLMEVRVNYNWANALPAGTLLSLAEGQNYLTVDTGVGGYTATKSRIIAQVLWNYPAASVAAGSSTELIVVRFRGVQGI